MTKSRFLVAESFMDIRRTKTQLDLEGNITLSSRRYDSKPMFVATYERY